MADVNYTFSIIPLSISEYNTPEISRICKTNKTQWFNSMLSIGDTAHIQRQIGYMQNIVPKRKAGVAKLILDKRDLNKKYCYRYRGTFHNDKSISQENIKIINLSAFNSWHPQHMKQTL